MVSGSRLVGGLDFCFCFLSLLWLLVLLMERLNPSALFAPPVSTSHKITFLVLARERWAASWLQEMGRPHDFFLPF